jgi:hypothetical protein
MKRLVVCLLLVVLSIGLAGAQEPSNTMELQKVSQACRTILNSSAADPAVQAMANRWSYCAKTRQWGDVTGRYIDMGKDEKGVWWVRAQKYNGEQVVIPYGKLDAASQQLLNEIWQLKYAILKAAAKPEILEEAKKDAAVVKAREREAAEGVLHKVQEGAQPQKMGEIGGVIAKKTGATVIGDERATYPILANPSEFWVYGVGPTQAAANEAALEVASANIPLGFGFHVIQENYDSTRQAPGSAYASLMDSAGNGVICNLLVRRIVADPLYVLEHRHDRDGHDWDREAREHSKEAKGEAKDSKEAKETRKDYKGSRTQTREKASATNPTTPSKSPSTLTVNPKTSPKILYGTMRMGNVVGGYGVGPQNQPTIGRGMGMFPQTGRFPQSGGAGQ